MFAFPAILSVILTFERSSLIFMQALFPEIKLVRDLIIVPYLE
jgi:hypothetical protein